MKNYLLAIALASLSLNVFAQDNANACEAAYQEKQYEQAFKLCQQNGSDAKEQYLLGEMYFYGQGVAKDFNLAMSWYRKAAEQEVSDAQYSIGWLYQQGLGVKQDYVQAMSWYRKAAEQGASDAQYGIGWLYQQGLGVKQDYLQAMSWYRKAADQGAGNAQNQIGWLYQNGLGVKQDFVQAMSWYRKAAEQGKSNAQNNIGLLYENGLGVKQDYVQAMSWYRKAADQGNAHALNNIGLLYSDGKGVEQNHADAVIFYAKAIDAGDEAAKGNILYDIPKLDKILVNGVANLYENIHSKGNRLMRLSPQSSVYLLDDSHPGWLFVYVSQNNHMGWIATSELKAGEKVAAVNQQSPYPAKPAPKAGATTCATKCLNGDCYRTYANGRKVHFQARQVFNPLTQQLEFDATGC